MKKKAEPVVHKAVGEFPRHLCGAPYRFSSSSFYCCRSWWPAVTCKRCLKMRRAKR